MTLTSLVDTTRSKRSQTPEVKCAAAAPIPGPGEYDPNVAPIKHHDPEYTFGSKPSPRKPDATPAANAYNVQSTVGDAPATQLGLLIPTMLVVS